MKEDAHTLRIAKLRAALRAPSRYQRFRWWLSGLRASAAYFCENVWVVVNCNLASKKEKAAWKHQTETLVSQPDPLERVRAEQASQLLELRAERDALLARKPLVAEDFRKLWRDSVGSLHDCNGALLEVLGRYSQILDYGDKLLDRGVNHSGNGQAPPELLEIHASFAVLLNHTAEVLSKSGKASLRMDEMLSSPGLDSGEPEPSHSFPAPNGPAQFFCASSCTLVEAKAKLRALRITLAPDHVLPLELEWLTDLHTRILQLGSKYLDGLDDQTA